MHHEGETKTRDDASERVPTVEELRDQAEAAVDPRLGWSPVVHSLAIRLHAALARVAELERRALHVIEHVGIGEYARGVLLGEVEPIAAGGGPDAQGQSKTDAATTRPDDPARQPTYEQMRKPNFTVPQPDLVERLRLRQWFVKQIEDDGSQGAIVRLKFIESHEPAEAADEIERLRAGVPDVQQHWVPRAEWLRVQAERDALRASLKIRDGVCIHAVFEDSCPVCLRGENERLRAGLREIAEDEWCECGHKLDARRLLGDPP